MEILLHIGIDTVDMAGDGFTYLVSLGQQVKAGDALIRFDREKIRQAGHPDTTVCVVTEEGEAAGSILYHTGMDVKAGESVVAAWR